MGAERMALKLLDAIEAAGIIEAGRTEREIEMDICALAKGGIRHRAQLAQAHRARRRQHAVGRRRQSPDPHGGGRRHCLLFGDFYERLLGADAIEAAAA